MLVKHVEVEEGVTIEQGSPKGRSCFSCHYGSFQVILEQERGFNGKLKL